jgi:hypothetical protein
MERDPWDDPEHELSASYKQTPRREERAITELKRKDCGNIEVIQDFLSIQLYKMKTMEEEEEEAAAHSIKCKQLMQLTCLKHYHCY